MNNTYKIFNLLVASAISLPGVEIPGWEPVDVTIMYARIDWCPEHTDQGGFAFRFTPTAAYLFWEHVGKFVVRNGNDVAIDPVEGVDEQRIRLPLMGTVLAVLLHQRGSLVLHASAVQVRDQAVVFLGDKGQGKSTMAAALHKNGHSLLADDLVVFNLSDQQPPHVLPGIRQIKLWPESLVSLGEDPSSLDVITNGVEKRFKPMSDGMASLPALLGSIFVLAYGKAIAIRQLSPAEAFTYLLANTYIARFGQQLLHGTAAIAHLRQCEHVLASATVSILERPRSLKLLPEIVDLLERQAGSPTV